MKHAREESNTVDTGNGGSSGRFKKSTLGGYYARKVAQWRAKQRAARLRGDYVEESGSDESESGSDSGSGSEDSDESGSDSDDGSNDSDHTDISDASLALETTQNEQRRILVEALEGAQLARYETYRRANVNAGGVRKVCTAAAAAAAAGAGGNEPTPVVQPEHAKVLAGVAKLFVADIVTKAVAIRDADRESNYSTHGTEGADPPQLTPDQIRRAWTAVVQEQGGSTTSVVGGRLGMPAWRSVNRRGHNGSLF